jgi:hypothetical protein
MTLKKTVSWHHTNGKMAWVPGKPMSWEIYTHHLGATHMKLSKGVASLPSIADYMFISLCMLLAYIVIIWYFDNVLSSNRGVGQPPYFIFTARYWRQQGCCTKKSKTKP